MDGRRFDRLTKALVAGSGSRSRRTVLHLLGGAALTAAVGRTPGAAADPIAAAGTTGSCRATGDACTGDNDCCSERCRSGHCQCRGRGAACTVDRACCSGRCRKRKGRCA